MNTNVQTQNLPQQSHFTKIFPLAVSWLAARTLQISSWVITTHCCLYSKLAIFHKYCYTKRGGITTNLILTWDTFHSCHNFPAGSRQAARGARICEKSLLADTISDRQLGIKQKVCHVQSAILKKNICLTIPISSATRKAKMGSVVHLDNYNVLFGVPCPPGQVSHSRLTASTASDDKMWKKKKSLFQEHHTS